MNNINCDKTVNVYGALKLIEQLYIDGHISENVFQGILDDYKFEVDINSFETKKLKK